MWQTDTSLLFTACYWSYCMLPFDNILLTQLPYVCVDQVVIKFYMVVHVFPKTKAMKTMKYDSN